MHKINTNFTEKQKLQLILSYKVTQFGPKVGVIFNVKVT